MISKRDTTNLPAALPIQPSGQFEGNDGKWSTFFLQAGTGTTSQQFHALVSTSSISTWLAIPQGCNGDGDPTYPSNCPALRGDISAGATGWQSAESPSYKALEQSFLLLNSDLPISAFGASPANALYVAQYGNASFVGTDQVALNENSSGSSSITVPNSVIYGVVDYSFFVDTVGVGYGTYAPAGSTAKYPSILQSLNDTGQIPSASWGYTAGSHYKNRLGSLVLGGYDANRFRSPATQNFKMPTGVNRTLLQVSVDQISLTYADGTSKIVNSANGAVTKYDAIIDTTLPFLYMPRSVCDSFQQLLGLNFDNTTGLYTVNSTQRAANSGLNITFMVADTQDDSISQTITLPYAAFDLNASWPMYASSTSYFPIRRSNSDDPNYGPHILGRTFLQEAYVIADYERGNFTIAQADMVSNDQLILPIYNETTQNQIQNTSPSKKLSTGAIVGIAVGAAALVAILLFALLFVHRRRQRNRRAAAAAAAATVAKEPQDIEMLESEVARRATLSSTYTGVTAETPEHAARHPHHLSELSSESGGIGVARGASTSGVGAPAIYELAEGKAAELESDPSDTAAWARNQRRLAQERREEQRFELPGDVPLGTEHSTSVTPRQVSIVPDGAEGWSPSVEGGLSPVGVTPEGVTPERDEERTLE